MDDRNEENLNELFGKFVDLEQARRALEDFQQAEQILREWPAPQPDDALVADIKLKVSGALLRKKANAFKRTVYKAAAVAAVFIILAVISVKLLEESDGKTEKVPYAYASIIPRAIWESEDIVADDADLAILTAEIEQIEDELRAVKLGENGGNGQAAVMELELELLEIDSDFWKG